MTLPSRWTADRLAALRTVRGCGEHGTALAGIQNWYCDPCLALLAAHIETAAITAAVERCDLAVIADRMSERWLGHQWDDAEERAALKAALLPEAPR